MLIGGYDVRPSLLVSIQLLVITFRSCRGFIGTVVERRKRCARSVLHTLNQSPTHVRRVSSVCRSPGRVGLTFFGNWKVVFSWRTLSSVMRVIFCGANISCSARFTCCPPDTPSPTPKSQINTIRAGNLSNHCKHGRVHSEVARLK